LESTSGSFYTYNDVIDRVQRLAAGFRAQGLTPGDVVCMYTPNHLDYAIAHYATALLGATFQTANPFYTVGE
jgi:acyl-CoA synthetase (AMP-forming)/AMP-acid ligase II